MTEDDYIPEPDGEPQEEPDDDFEPLPYCEVLTQVENEDGWLQAIDGCHKRAAYRVTMQSTQKFMDVCGEHLGNIAFLAEKHELVELKSCAFDNQSTWDQGEEPF